MVFIRKTKMALSGKTDTVNLDEEERRKMEAAKELVKKNIAPDDNPQPGVTCKSRVVALAQCLKRAESDPLKLRWEGGSTPATRNLIHCDILDMICKRESRVYDSSTAFISTSYEFDSDSSLPLIKVNDEWKRAVPVLRLPSSVNRTNQLVVLKSSINGFSNGPLTWDNKSSMRLRQGGWSALIRDGCFFTYEEEWSDKSCKTCEISLTEVQKENGIVGVQNRKDKFFNSSLGLNWSEPNKDKSIVRKHVDDFEESAKRIGPELEAESTVPVGEKEGSNFKLNTKLGRVFDLKLCDRVLLPSKSGQMWSCSLYLGMEHYANHPQLSRLFFSQNRYLNGLRDHIDFSEVKASPLPISKSYEGEYREAMDKIIEENPELKETNDSESAKDKWEKILGKKPIKSQQVICGRVMQIAKVGSFYTYPLRRLSSATPVTPTIRALKQFERHIAERPFLRAAVPANEQFDSEGFPRLHYRSFSDSDHQGEYGGLSISCGVTAVNGIVLDITSQKQPVALGSVTESELNACVSEARSVDSYLEFVSELNITRESLISESAVLDNNASIELSFGKTLSKRSRAFRSRELLVRQKVQSPMRIHPFSVEKIESSLNPADGGTKPLTRNQWSRHCEQVDIIFTPALSDLDNMQEMVEKYGELMETYEPAENRYRRGNYR